MGSVRSWGGTLNSCTSSNVQCSLTESVQVTGHPVMTSVFFPGVQVPSSFLAHSYGGRFTQDMNVSLKKEAKGID